MSAGLGSDFTKFSDWKIQRELLNLRFSLVHYGLRITLGNLYPQLPPSWAINKMLPAEQSSFYKRYVNL